VFKKIKFFSEEQYLEVLKEYMDFYTAMFFGLDVKAENLIKFFEHKGNERFRYPLYFLWTYGKDIFNEYEKINKNQYVNYGADILSEMYFHPRYRDIHFCEFYDILDRRYNVRLLSKRNEAVTNEDNIANESLRKFFWQIVVEFKMKYKLYGDRIWIY